MVRVRKANDKRMHVIGCKLEAPAIKCDVLHTHSSIWPLPLPSTTQHRTLLPASALSIGAGHKSNVEPSKALIPRNTGLLAWTNATLSSPEYLHLLPAVSPESCSPPVVFTQHNSSMQPVSNS